MLILSLLVVGCSSNTEQEVTTEAPGTTVAESTEPAAPAKDTLIVGMGADAKSLDPHATNDQPSSRVAKQIYNTLVNQNEAMELEPGLAESWTQIDDLTYEFKLKQGVMFHNGEELKASDVKFTILRALESSHIGHIVGAIDGEKIEIVEAGHPIPDNRGIQATNRVIELLKRTQKDDLVICLISGGGSALMVSPVEGISLAELQDLTAELLASGATINEINTLRKHLDQVKGGQIARYATPARLVSLILSDVVGDPLDVIASGPTVPDSTTFDDAIEILNKYQIEHKISRSIIKHLNSGRAGEIPETPKENDGIFKNVTNFMIGSNLVAGNGTLEQARKEGFHSMVLTNYLQGEAKEVAITLAAILRQMASNNPPIPRPACIILGGETTVTLHGNGQGGRNQEIALASVYDLSGIEDIALITLATDGGDGPTDAAGAVVTGETFLRAQKLGMDPQKYLRNNDSYNFFKTLNDLVITGPTQTNVNDLVFLFSF